MHSEDYNENGERKRETAWSPWAWNVKSLTQFETDFPCFNALWLGQQQRIPNQNKDFVSLHDEDCVSNLEFFYEHQNGVAGFSSDERDTTDDSDYHGEFVPEDEDVADSAGNDQEQSGDDDVELCDANDDSEAQARDLERIDESEDSDDESERESMSVD